VWEWKVMKVHTNHAHEIIRNELSLIGEFYFARIWVLGI